MKYKFCAKHIETIQLYKDNFNLQSSILNKLMELFSCGHQIILFSLQTFPS